MSATKQMGKEDVMFVAGESSTVYQHTAGLVMLDSSERPEFGFDHFRDFCTERIALIPHFRWKLHEVPLGLDRPYWVEDKNFNFDHHIKRIAVPSPGDRVALSEVVSYLYSRHLDRSKPLWEIWFIEGLEDGRFAILQKLHHCLMDGQGASKLGQILCDLEPDGSEIKTVDKTISGAVPGRVPGQWERAFHTTRYLMGLPSELSKGLYDIVRPTMFEKFSWKKKAVKDKAAVPVTSFNADIIADRAFVFDSLSLPDIKTVKDHFGVTVNDVVLALVSGTMRNYLLSYSKLPRESLRTSLPVSLHRGNEGDADSMSNKVTTISVSLATDLDDPVARLRAISAESDALKNRARKGGKGFMEVLQLMPPIVVSSLLSLVPSSRIPQFFGSNMVVSNVRGSPIPLYIAGARLETMYPMSILTGGLGINVTCLSYVDKLDFGIALDPILVPQPWALIDGLNETLAEYLHLCSEKGSQTTRKKVPAKSKASAKRKVPAKRQPAKKAKTA